MTLFSSGNLAVGPTSDSGFKLDVNGTGRFSGVLTTNSGTNSTNGIQIISSLSSSLFTGGIEFFRTGVAGGSKVQPLRDAAIGGVGLNFLVTANNTAEVNATYTSALQILNTGAATFSSSVTANSLKAEASGAAAFLYFNNTASPASNYIALGSAANELYFQVNGADRIVIKPNGNVLIGTTTDTGERLRVNGVGRFDDGLKTGPIGTSSSRPTWRLGVASSGTVIPDKIINVEIDGISYVFAAREN
jgi:hypothetical protein